MKKILQKSHLLNYVVTIYPNGLYKIIVIFLCDKEQVFHFELLDTEAIYGGVLTDEAI